MSEIDDLDTEISTLQYELAKRLKNLNDTKRTSEAVKHSTTTSRDLSDSGVVRTRRIDDNTIPTSRENVRSAGMDFLRADSPRDDFEAASSAENKGARPRTSAPNLQSTPHGGFERRMNAPKMPSLTPIMEPRDPSFRLERASASQFPANKRRDIKLANYDGSGEWNDFKSHFDACAELNEWDERDKGLYLATALRGQAQGVFSDLPTGKKMEFKTLVKALEERFAPPNQTELYRVQLKDRRQRASESLPELGQAIRRLVNKAYVNAPAEIKEMLSTEHFLDALVDSEIRIKIKQSRPANLNQAICLAVELEAFYKAERKYETGRGHMRAACVHEDNIENPLMEQMNVMIRKLTAEIDSIRNEVYKLTSIPERRQRQETYRDNIVECFKCGQKGHKAHQCESNAHHVRSMWNDSATGSKQLIKLVQGLQETVKILHIDVQQLKEKRRHRNGKDRSTGTIRCYRCRKLGHKAANCRKERTAKKCTATNVTEASPRDAISKPLSVRFIRPSVNEVKSCKLKCQKCSSSFTKKKYLNRHIRRKHAGDKKTVDFSALSAAINTEIKTKLANTSNRNVSCTQVKHRDNKLERQKLKFYCCAHRETNEAGGSRVNALTGGLTQRNAAWGYACRKEWSRGQCRTPLCVMV